MAYATLSHVQALAPARTFTATSTPDASQVFIYLGQTAAELDGLLKEKGYALPIPTTATSALKLLEHYNAIGAWAFVEAGAKSSRDEDRAQALWENAQKMLRDGLIQLDAPTDIELSLPRAQPAASPFFFRAQEF